MEKQEKLKILNMVYSEEELKDMREILQLRKSLATNQDIPKKIPTIFEHSEHCYGTYSLNEENNRYERICSGCGNIDSMSVEDYESIYSRTGR